MAHARKRTISRPASDLFTNRRTESGAFADSLRAHRAMLDTESSDEDDTTANNILVYHGVGGIGKTTLSMRLQDWCAGRLPAEDEWGSLDTPVDATVRVDLHSSQGHFDVTNAILDLRRVLADIKPRWPAFDLAFGAWWASAHPDEDVPQPSDGKDKGVAAAIRETIGDIASEFEVMGLPLGLGLKAARVIARKYSQVQDKRFVSRVVSDEIWYEDLLQRCADVPTQTDPHPELLVECAELLAQEMAELEHCPLVVMFIDTFERLQMKGDLSRTGEALFNRLVWGLPLVLFVVTGRNRLDWDDQRRTTLPHVGPATWPGLAAGAGHDPRQHLVGDLSETDAQSLMLKTRESLALPISDEVIDAVVHASHGLPQYLDLAREVALRARSNGAESVSLADVTGSLGDLVERVMSDVPADEQRAVRAASLFTRFNPELIAAAAGVEVGCAERAITRPMVQKWDGSDFPYRMHDTIRAAIRHAGHHVDGGWAPEDWSLVNGRALDYLRRKIAAATERGRSSERIRATGMAVSLVCAENVRASEPNIPSGDWLQQAIIDGPVVGGLRPHVPVASQTAYGQGFVDYIAARSSYGTLDQRLSLLSGIVDAGHPMADNAVNSLALVQRNAERFDDAIAAWDRAIADDPSPYRLYQRRLTLAMGRRCQDALDGIAELDEVLSDRVHTRVRYIHGDVETILESHLQRVEEATAAGEMREAREARVDYLWRQAVFGEGVNMDDALEVVRQNEEYGHSYCVMAGLAMVVFVEPTGTAAEDALGRMRRIGPSASGMPDPLLALATVGRAWVLGDSATLQTLAESLQGSVHQMNDWVPVEVLLNHLGFPVDDPPAQWLEPRESVDMRWLHRWWAWHERVARATPRP